MKQRDKVERERIEWEKTKNLGIGKFLLSDGFYRFGLPIGVIFGITLQIIENGFHFGNFFFVKNLFFGSVVFSISGLLSSLITWKRKEKEYS